jgi:hypothetical protein
MLSTGTSRKSHIQVSSYRIHFFLITFLLLLKLFSGYTPHSLCEFVHLLYGRWMPLLGIFLCKPVPDSVSDISVSNYDISH